jgi:dihydrofolate synthase/folylpolyglutamate synthase
MTDQYNLQEWLSLLEKRHSRTIDLGLQRCGEVYRKLGSPKPAKTVFTVAGTNGKGSTVTYLAALAAAMGFRYGTYTSPHILRFNERISVMGIPVSDEVLIDAFRQVEAARGDISLSYFEFSTLAGFLILQQAGLDVAVLEVGLGGRLDTVNLVDADCAVITPIGLDHQDYLGPDIESIATEKAGIMRAGTPVVCTQQAPPLAIVNAARKMNAPLSRNGVEFKLLPVEHGLLEFSMKNSRMQVPPPALVGRHQLDNLAAALAAFCLIFPQTFGQAVAIGPAIKSCLLPGRMQQFGQEPVIYVDVGHNPLAAEAVAAFFKARQVQDVVCVLAMLADKDAEAVASELAEVCSDWLCADSSGERAQSGQVLATRVGRAIPDASVQYFSAFEAAIDHAISLAAGQRTILVFGSFTTASAFMQWLQKTHAAKRP